MPLTIQIIHVRRKHLAALHITEKEMIHILIVTRTQCLSLPNLLGAAKELLMDDAIVHKFDFAPVEICKRGNLIYYSMHSSLPTYTHKN